MTNFADILRVFADPKKVKLLGQLCDEPLPLHTLARAAGLSETETMGLVQSLKEAGLLEETFAHDGFRWRYKPQAIFEALRETKAAASASDLPPGASVYEARVLGDFFVGGKLRSIPVQRKKREVVLRYLAGKFEAGRTYTEQEVSFLLLNYHEDYASLRREMVDTGLMERANGIYRLMPLFPVDAPREKVQCAPEFIPGAAARNSNKEDDTMALVDNAVAAYTRRFGAAPRAAAPRAAALAPGRVEIMGNHTDYNGGFVLPAALDKGTVVAGSATGNDTISLHAADFRRDASFSAKDLRADPYNSWAGYVLGVVQQLQREGVAVGGFNAVIHSDVPGGAGLSSSAALEVATAFFLQQLFPFDRDPMQIARLCQRAENEFVGVPCGILDQFSSVFGVQDGLLFLDCLTLEHSAVKMGRDDIAIVVCDSNVKHALTSGDYATRHAECMAAAAHFGKPLLREVPWEEFTAREGELPENQQKRARHVLTEDKRVLAMREAAQKGDTAHMGRLLAEGHASCRDLFENSTPEIDLLVSLAVRLPGCIGAKLTGGGWGGCSVNLVHAEAVPQFCRELAAQYKEKTGYEAHVYACRAAQGARAVKV